MSRDCREPPDGPASVRDALRHGCGLVRLPEGLRSPQVRAFVLAFSAALLARALLVLVVVQVEGCTLAQYANSADGYQFKAVASGWLGDLGAVRSQEFFKQLVASGGLGSSHLLRFFPAGSGPLALCMGAGLPEGPCSTIPAWIFSALAAGLAALWARDARVGLLVGFFPSIGLRSSTVFSGGWDLVFVLAGLLFLRAERPGAAGIALGVAGWARPEALFPVIGVLVGLAIAQRGRDALRVGAGTGVALACSALAVLWRFSPLLDAILQRAGPRASEGIGFLDIPGRALFNAATAWATPVWKLPYVGLHLILAFVALAALVGRARWRSPERHSFETWALLVWLALQLLLVLSLRGSQGFDDAPRYLGVASFAIVVGLLPWLPRRRWIVGALCLASFALALYPAIKNARPECSERLDPVGSPSGLGGQGPSIGLPRVESKPDAELYSFSRRHSVLDPTSLERPSQGLTMLGLRSGNER